MTRFVILMLWFGLPLLAQEPPPTQPGVPASAGLLPQSKKVDLYPQPEGQTFYRWSLAAVAAGNAADTFSSWRQPERNPLLGGTFDGRSMAIKGGLLGTSFLIQHFALKHNPQLYRKLAWMNIAIGGGLGAAAAHNFNIR